MKLFNNKSFSTIGLAAVLLMPSSCNKTFLDTPPIGAISETTLLTREGVNGVLIGAYSLLNGTARFGSYDFLNGVSNIMLAGVASDDAKKGCIYDAITEIDQAENHSIDATQTFNADRWKAIYAGVQRTNEAIRFANKVSEDIMSIEEKNQVIAEARFLRGVYHLEAAKLWRNVPYINEDVYYGAPDMYVSNNEPIWPKIEEDFSFAAGNLTETKVNIGRANKWAAKSFLAKTYMMQNKWSDAKPLLDDIIANGVTSSGVKYKLVDKYKDTYDPASKNSSESVFAVQMAAVSGDNGYNGNAGESLTLPVPDGGAWYQPSFDLVNAFKTDPATGLPLLNSYNDVDMTNDMGLDMDDPFTPYAGTIDARLDWTVGRRGIPYLDWGVFNKGYLLSHDGGPYCHMKSAYWQKDKSSTVASFEGWAFVTSVNYTMIRYADILLWAAECEVEIGSLAKAEQYVNIVRARAANPDGFVKKYIDDNDPQRGFTNTPAANYFVGLYNGDFEAKGQVFARESVRFERRLEFGMEGVRFFDMQRYDQQQPGYMADVLNAYIARETKSYVDAGEPAYLIFRNASFTKGKNEVFPIPQREIDLSVVNGQSVLKQNPGYN